MKEYLQIFQDELSCNLQQIDHTYHVSFFNEDMKVECNVIPLNKCFQQTKDKDYLISTHIQRMNDGWRCISVFEDELVNKPEIVLSRFRNIIGATKNKIYARKCKIVEVEPKEARLFFNKTHIQGTGRGASLFLGLENDGQLVTCTSFGIPRYNQVATHELIRFASALDMIVVGGASRLITFAREKYTLEKLVSYADYRFGFGDVYAKSGFNLENVSSPSYWYYKESDPSQRYHRSAFQKHKLHKQLETFDPNLTELKNMELAGWCRKFDAGCGVYLV